MVFLPLDWNGGEIATESWWYTDANLAIAKSNTSKPPANGYLQVAAFPDILADGAEEFVHDTSLSAKKCTEKIADTTLFVV